MFLIYLTELYVDRACLVKMIFVCLENSIVIASDTELSKMTALLISAGLWPPPEKQIWNETILWQPVSYTYPPRKQDYVSHFSTFTNVEH